MFMRYVITKDQFHKIVYNILDEMMDGGNVERENNPKSNRSRFAQLPRKFLLSVLQK